MKLEDITRVLYRIYQEKENLTKNDIVERIQNIITHYELHKKIANFDGREQG